MPTFRKDPDAVLDYIFDWTAYLEGTDELATHTIEATSGITVDSSSRTTTAVTVWLSGGTAGSNYSVACLVTTADGRTDERTMTVQVRER